MVVSSPAKAKKVLGALRIRCTEQKVLCVTLPNELGTLVEVGTRPGAADISIKYGFAIVRKARRKRMFARGL